MTRLSTSGAAAICALAVLASCTSGGRDDPGNGGPGPTPTPLPGDPSACPPGFTSGLDAGQHTGFASGGQSRSFHVLLPPSSFGGPRPLLFAFHGTGMTGASAIASYGLQTWAAAGFVVVAPDSIGNGTVWPVWDALTLPGTPAAPNADLALFDDLLECVAGHHSVDAKRIYVAGHSAGGAMTHFLLGRRSSLLAGGIPASGAFDLTQPTPPQAIDPMIVIVTWGGSNDVYSGAAGGTSVANIGYVEQSALASQHWERQPGSHQIACRGHDLGHVWLGVINGWMRDVLLAHPKGAAVVPGWSLPSLPAGAPASCSEEEATYTPSVTVACSSSPTAGCTAYCQMLGDCLVENGTLGPVAAPQLVALGFSGAGDVCAGCIATCASDAQGSTPDVAVLDCLSSSAPTAACGPGFAGAAAFGVVGGCCDGAVGSRVCARFCTTFQQSSLFAPMLTGCP